LSVITIPAIGYLCLLNKNIQNYLANKITSGLSGYFNTKVVIGNVGFDMLNRLVIHNIYIEDQNKDTLLYSNKLILALNSINIKSKQINIEKVELENAYIHLFIDSTKTVNLKFIIDKLSGSADTTKKGWNLTFKNMGIIDSRFQIENEKKRLPGPEINFTNIRITNLNCKIKSFKTANHITSFKINKLSFHERSGFILKNLSSVMKIRKNFMHFDNIQIATPNSKINAPKIYFDFNDFKEFNNFSQAIYIDFVFYRTLFSLSDIAYFVPQLSGFSEKATMSGEFKGKLNDIRCKEIILKLGKGSLFDGNISLTGLPKIHETFVYINARKLLILPSELENFYFPGVERNRLKLPEILKKLGYIDFKGNFTGFINDFVIYGTFKTQLGIIKTDFSLMPESKERIAFDGKLTAIGFDAGQFFDQEKIIGKADINVNAHGIIENKNKVTGTLNGNINHFFYNGYTFSDISVNGSLKENIFDGNVTLDDPNLKFGLNGKFNFTKSIPEFDFSANLLKAYLYNLNIIHKDSGFNISCMLNAKFKGTRFQNIKGQIDLKNVHLQRQEKDIIINWIALNSNDNEINVKSDVLDAQIIGNFNLGTFVSSLANTFKIYMPSSFKSIKTPQLSKDNFFAINIELKKILPFCDFFLPNIYFAPNTNFTGIYHPADSVVTFEITADYFQTGKNKFDNLKINGIAQHDSIVFTLKSNKFLLGDQFNLDQFEINSTAHNDSLFSIIKWKNNDSIKSSSQILSMVNFTKSKEKEKPVLNINVYPAKVILLDSLWKIYETKITIDSSGIAIPDLTITQNNQIFHANGKISQNPEDTLNLNFVNFDLRNLKLLIKSKNISFEGILNGKANLADFYHNPIFNADLKINQLFVNSELVGSTSINVSWDNELKQITAKAEAYKSGSKVLFANGGYFPSSKSVNFIFDVDKLGLKIFQPFINNVFTLQNGTETGRLVLTGNIYKPLLNGIVEINNAKFMINYLKTNFGFSTKLNIQDNNFLFNNVSLLDNNNNVCTANGKITNIFFKDFYLNLNLILENLQVLNTVSTDNRSYYGKAFASGTVHITGPPQNINIDVIQGKTEKNTVIYIPLGRTANVTENNFLTFLEHKTTQVRDSFFMPKQYEVNLSGLTLNLDLNITPDAEVQLIFDPKVGDMLRSSGQGNLKIEINTLGNFNMRGDYIIESGDYFFTLKNLINKKFILQPGGLISWNGNPLDANIDIKALYHTKAALSNLSPVLIEHKTRIPIDCQLFIKGKLLNPDITYDISLPNSTEETQNIIKDYINNEEALSYQFLMLLVTNNFMPSQNASTTTEIIPSFTGSSIASDLATTTSYEFLSSQLSNWISQVSKDFDLGVTYKPGEQNITNSEVEVALSTQLLNDRISINGNFDVIGNTNNPKNNTNNLVGDVNVDVKLTDNGKFKLKAYNHVNDQFSYEQAPYTQGVGLTYREEFTNFGELEKRYLQKLFKPKNKKQSSKSSETQLKDKK